jgi:hypothetical protein
MQPLPAFPGCMIGSASLSTQQSQANTALHDSHAAFCRLKLQTEIVATSILFIWLASMTTRASVTYDTCSHDSTCASPPNLHTPPAAQLVHQGRVGSITPGKHSSTPLPACTELAGEARCQHGSGNSSCSKMFPLLQRIAHALGGPSKLHARMKSAQYASGEPKMHHPCVH